MHRRISCLGFKLVQVMNMLFILGLNLSLALSYMCILSFCDVGVLRLEI